MAEKGVKRKAFKAAFPYTIPIFLGFWFLGFAYGIYMSTSGFSFFYPFFMAIVIFGGSLEFIAVSMLLSPFAPLQTLLVALMVQARHLFYGISMLERYNGMGWKKFFLIYGMCDETFSINYSIKVPDGVDKGWFMLFITWLNEFYWVSGSLIGGLIGGHLPFNTEGLDFAMTALFVVIFLEQVLKEDQHVSTLIGLVGSITCLMIFGADSFMIPTMVTILLLLTAFRRPLTKEGGLRK